MTEKQLLILVCCLALFFTGWVIFLYYQLFAKSEKSTFAFNQVSEILNTSVDGYFCFLYAPGKGRATEVCSRRLAILLGITDEKIRFSTVLQKLDLDSRQQLEHHLRALIRQGHEFHLTIQELGQKRSFFLHGKRASSMEGIVLADIIWVQLAAPESEQILVQKLKQSEEKMTLVSSVLDDLPVPVWIRNSDLMIEYCNQAYARQVSLSPADVVKEQKEIDAEDTKGLKYVALQALKNKTLSVDYKTVFIDDRFVYAMVIERPIDMDRPLSIGMLIPCPREKELETDLKKYINMHYQVLGQLSVGILILNAKGIVQYSNTAYQQMWKLDDKWLSSGVNYGDVLDMLRTKRMLPETGDFLEYKHQELKLFSTLSQSMEQIVYLPTGAILKKTMHPYPLGGVMILYQDVTDRISLQESFNEQIKIGQSLVNQMNSGVLIFNAVGRVKLYNTAFTKMWDISEEMLSSDPTLYDVLEAERPKLVSTEDAWILQKQTILNFIEQNEGGSLKLSCVNGQDVLLSSNYLPDGGLFLSYEKV